MAKTYMIVTEDLGGKGRQRLHTQGEGAAGTVSYRFGKDGSASIIDFADESIVNNNLGSVTNVTGKRAAHVSVFHIK